MLTVHHSPRSRSTRILWLLEELGADYDVNYVDIARRDGNGAADPKNPHPLKQTPAITHDGVDIVESVIIVSHLVDAFPQNGLAPRHGTVERARFDSWLGLYGGVLEPVAVARFSPDGMTPIQAEAYDVLESQWRGALEKGPFLLGDTFSAVDVLFGSLLQFYRSAMPDHAVYDAYVERLNARPALAKAMTRDEAG